MDLKFNFIGGPAYQGSLTEYRVDIPLKDLTSTSVKIPCFIIPKGTNVLATKCVYVEDVVKSGGTVDLTVDVGTYKIASDGSIGTAITADKFLAAAATVDKTAGTVVEPAVSAILTTEDTVIVAMAKTVTTPPETGVLRIQMLCGE